MRVAVVGATGLTGRQTVAALEAAGHETVTIARSAGVDVVTGAGLDQALTGVDAVIDVVNTGATEAAETERFFGTVTANLLAAEQRAGVGHHVLLSIVGIDRVGGNAHYAGKRRQEELVAAGPVAWTIQRATQFFDFAAMVVGWTRSDGAATIAPLLVQPLAVADVGAVLAELATGPPQGRAPDLAGPDPQDLVDMARRTLAARHDDTRLVPSWRNGPFGVEMAGEVLLPGAGARLAPTPFETWLAAPAAPAAPDPDAG
jgi:uncharacterized protein YbjT (DUF2867 family)